MRAFILGFFFAVTLVGQASLAAVEESGSISESVSRASKFKIDLFGFGSSGSLNDGDGRAATYDGRPGDPVTLTNQIQLQYPISSSMNFVVMPIVKLQPFTGQFFNLADPTVGVQGLVYAKGGFSYWARYDTSIPMTAAAHSSGLITAPGAVNSIGYQFPGTKFKLEGVFVPSVSIFNNGQASSFVYLSPRAYYLASDSWWFLGIMESTFSSVRGGDLLALTGNQSTIGAGFRYTSLGGKGMYVQPFLNVFPGGKVDSEAHLGVMFGGPIL